MDEMQTKPKVVRDRNNVKAKCKICKRRLWVGNSGLFCKNGHNNNPHVAVSRTPKKTISTAPKSARKVA